MTAATPDVAALLAQVVQLLASNPLPQFRSLDRLLRRTGCC
jgi:hypothetical protein